MKILFCNIASMKWYKDICPNEDEPTYGGAYVSETGDAHEKYNFLPITIDDKEFCTGFFETKKTNRKTKNQLHIEKIEGVSASDNSADGVLAVWCARADTNRSTVVGWYKNATVYREYECIEIEYGEDEPIYRDYNVWANAEDCVLLPQDERNVNRWRVPREKYNRSYGFGQANVWFASEDSAKPYIEQLVLSIDEYRGENWLKTYPPSLEKLLEEIN